MATIDRLPVEVGFDRVDGPSELFEKSFREDLVERNVVLFAPLDGNSRIDVVDLGSTERDFCRRTETE